MENIKHRLVSFPSCPVCNNSKRNKVSNSKAFSDGGRQYLRFIAEKEGISIQELSNNITIYQCEFCSSFWCDPWFNENSSSQIFTIGSPDHSASWSSFEQWLCKPEHKASLAPAKLYKILESRIGTISRYAEFGCPFNGFFLLFRGLEVDLNTRINIFADAIRPLKDPRWSIMMRIDSMLTRFTRSITIGYFKLSLFKEKVKISDNIIEKGALPKEKVFLTKESTRSWGNNCVRYGGSCKYFSSKVLGTEVIPLGKKLELANQNNHIKYDLIGIFNILDHTDQPLKIIRDCLSLAKNVLIVSHTHNTAGKQHLFAFDDSFPKFLSNFLNDEFLVSDLTETFYNDNQDTVYKDHKYILISQV